MLIFEDEGLKSYLTSKEAGYGDKLERLVKMFGGSQTSIINRIKAMEDMTNSSKELFEAVLDILDKKTNESEVFTKHERMECIRKLPYTPPTLTGGTLSTDKTTDSYGLANELNVLVGRVGLLHAGYIIEKVMKGKTDVRIGTIAESTGR